MIRIRKNSKEAKKAIANAQSLVRYDLANCFNGTPISDMTVFKSRVYNKIYKNESGVYTMNIHSNLWYEFKAAA